MVRQFRYCCGIGAMDAQPRVRLGSHTRHGGSDLCCLSLHLASRAAAVQSAALLNTDDVSYEELSRRRRLSPSIEAIDGLAI
jgi:hypothetical protein